MAARFLVLILVAVTAHLSVAEGRSCDCQSTTVETSTRIYSDIIKGVVTDTTTSPNATITSYLVKISWVYQGCLAKNGVIQVDTPADDCSVALTPGSTWYLSGTLDKSNALQIDACGGSRPWRDLAQNTTNFLDTVVNTCTGECANAPFVACFVEPCSVSKCAPRGATCEDNYCGGCHAYWWKDNILQCIG